MSQNMAVVDDQCVCFQQYTSTAKPPHKTSVSCHTYSRYNEPTYPTNNAIVAQESIPGYINTSFRPLAISKMHIWAVRIILDLQSDLFLWLRCWPPGYLRSITTFTSTMHTAVHEQHKHSHTQSGLLQLLQLLLQNVLHHIYIIAMCAAHERFCCSFRR